MRIAGGVVTEKNEYPWHVGIMVDDYDWPWCGGSILSSRTILTAAHCFTDHAVVVAEHAWTVTGDGEQKMEVCNRVDHPKYNPDTVEYDIAILTLCKDIIFNKTASPVCLPSQPDSDYANVPAIVTGWGFLEDEGLNRPEQLMELVVNTIPNTECSIIHADTDTDIKESMICANNPGKGICFGDSGGHYYQHQL